MSWLQNLPIKRRLTLVILMTCSAVLLLACGALALYQWFDFRNAMLRDITVLSDVVANNARAALAFQDEAHAQELLQALRSEPEIVEAGLYLPSGVRFAEYTRAGKPQMPVRLSANGYRYEHGYLELFRPVTLQGKHIGTLHVRAEMSGVMQRIRVFGAIAALVLLGSCVVALLLSAPMQRPISQPILALAETARAVGERN